MWKTLEGSRGGLDAVLRLLVEREAWRGGFGALRGPQEREWTLACLGGDEDEPRTGVARPLGVQLSRRKIRRRIFLVAFKDLSFTSAVGL